MIPWFQYTEINFGFLKFNVWGILVSLGFLAGIIVAYLELKRKKLEAKRIIDLAFWILLFSVIGSRLFYVLENLSVYLLSPLDIFKLWHGGMSVYGGFIGAAISGIVYLRKHKLDFWKYADALIFSLPLGLFIGRLGCFFIHDHPGTRTDFFLGVAYPGGARHDLGLYLSLNGLVLFLIFLFLRRKNLFDGFYLCFFAVWYGIVRFSLDFLRTKEAVLGLSSDPRYFGLTLAQYVSIVLFGAGIFLFFKLKNKNTEKEKIE